MNRAQSTSGEQNKSASELIAGDTLLRFGVPVRVTGVERTTLRGVAVIGVTHCNPKDGSQSATVHFVPSHVVTVLNS